MDTIRVEIRALTRRIPTIKGAERVDTIIRILSLESLLRDKARVARLGGAS